MTERIDREIIGGHLLVIGGAEDKYNERRILRKFLELAGGEKSEILIVPVASDFPEFAADVYTQAFRNLGVANPRVLRATSRQDVVQAEPGRRGRRHRRATGEDRRRPHFLGRTRRFNASGGGGAKGIQAANAGRVA